MSSSLIVKKMVDQLSAALSLSAPAPTSDPVPTPWPPEFAERLAMAAYDAQEAALQRTGDEDLSLRVMALWVEEYQAALIADPATVWPELATESEINPFGRDDPDPAAAGQLDRLLRTCGFDLAQPAKPYLGRSYGSERAW